MNTAASINPKAGSALLIVLAVMAILSLLVAEFGRGLRADLRASGGFYEEAQNDQLARSALVAAQIELSTAGASMYADPTGNVYFVTSDETYEPEIVALAQYRQGQSLGRGLFSYRFVMKPYALNINELDAAALGRLFEVACGLEDGDERSALVDSILDWMDSDNIARAYGAEEDFYQALVPPRHCRNAPFEMVEELLLVNGMTPEMLFGYGYPVRIENGMLLSGGLYRFLIGDNCPEAQASVQYILRGIFPSDEQSKKKDVEVVSGFQKITVLPAVLYLVAEGYSAPATGDKESPAPVAEESTPADSTSRHIILVKLTLPKNARSAAYTVGDFQENAAGELLEQVLAYGVPEENNEL
ncbi:MAG: hypothetical protein WCG03_07240 [Kiritimatiellales bacterium]